MMLKYIDTYIGFSEIPDEITLSINISGCTLQCPGCHSPWLWKDTGNLLTISVLEDLIQKNDGITTICFMGGDHNTIALNELAQYIKNTTILNVGWYSGKNNLNAVNTIYFDYIKLGAYNSYLGGLDSPKTNQKLYKKINNKWENITFMFWNE